MQLGAPVETLADTTPQFVPNRQRLTAPSGGEKEKPLPLTDEGKSLADYGVTDGAKLRLKDLGYQVGYRWLFIWEYVGNALGRS